jgi:hypothetical protein
MKISDEKEVVTAMNHCYHDAEKVDKMMILKI